MRLSCISVRRLTNPEIPPTFRAYDTYLTERRHCREEREWCSNVRLTGVPPPHRTSRLQSSTGEIPSKPAASGARAIKPDRGE